MESDLTPSERSLRASIAAHTLHAKRDSKELTEAARAASPGSLSYFEKLVDPDGVLADAERLRRSEHARSAHFARLSLASSKARRRRKVDTR